MTPRHLLRAALGVKHILEATRAGQFFGTNIITWQTRTLFLTLLLREDFRALKSAQLEIAVLRLVPLKIGELIIDDVFNFDAVRAVEGLVDDAALPGGLDPQQLARKEGTSAERRASGGIPLQLKGESIIYHITC